MTGTVFLIIKCAMCIYPEGLRKSENVLGIFFHHLYKNIPNSYFSFFSEKSRMLNLIQADFDPSHKKQNAVDDESLQEPNPGDNHKT